MALLPQTLEQLVRVGANIEITDGASYLPQTLELIVRIAAENGSHVTINANGILPQTLEQLAKIGGNHLTIRV